MPDPELSPLQDAIYWTMIELKDRDGTWPTLQQIADALDRDKVNIWEGMQRLHAKGIVRKSWDGKARCYSIAPEWMPPAPNIVIPIEGRIRAREKNLLDSDRILSGSGEFY